MAKELLKASNFLCFLVNCTLKLVALSAECWEYSLKNLGTLAKTVCQV